MNKYSIDVFYQPIISIEKQCVVGVEALMRAYDKGKLLPTYETIRDAENNNCIEDLSYEVFNKALREFQRIDTKNLFLNISPKLLENNAFPEDLSSLIKQERRSYICEVTESPVEVNFDAVVRNIRKLQEKGFRIALDDYNTGRSREYLASQINFDIIKLDRTVSLLAYDDPVFLNNILKELSEKDSLIIAEGIESDEHKNKMIDHGCSYFQGYLFGRPIGIKQYAEASSIFLVN